MGASSMRKSWWRSITDDQLTFHAANEAMKKLIVVEAYVI